MKNLKVLEDTDGDKLYVSRFSDGAIVVSAGLEGGAVELLPDKVSELVAFITWADTED